MVPDMASIAHCSFPPPENVKSCGLPLSVLVEKCSHWLQSLGTHPGFLVPGLFVPQWSAWSPSASLCLGTKLCLCTRCPWLVCGGNKGHFHPRGTTWSMGLTQPYLSPRYCLPRASFILWQVILCPWGLPSEVLELPYPFML